jgi:hypothetical protein
VHAVWRLRRRLDNERHLFGRNLAAVRVAGLRAADATPEVERAASKH